MKLGVKGNKRFVTIMKLAGVPKKERDIMILQKGEHSETKRKVDVEWEDS